MKQLFEGSQSLVVLALLHELHSGLIVLERGTGRDVAADFSTVDVDFLRLGAADLASCIMDIPGAVVSNGRCQSQVS